MPVHAWMTPKYRSEVMEKFASGKVKVIFATEAAGMGCDISNIKRVFQFGICGSIDAFMQRIGRAWRGPDGKGEGRLIYERWVPGCSADKAPKDKGKAPANKKGKAPANGGKTQATGDADKSTPATKTERKCDPLIQQFITESVCRRQYLNRVYGNPKSKTVVPPQDCCDLCDPNSATRIPSREFPMQRGPPRAARVSGEPNPDMLACLRAWRSAAFSSAFGISRMFGASALISDTELERISRCAPVSSIDRLRSYLVKWPHVNSQLESMWEALKAGGFALPVEPAEAVASTSRSITRPQPTPGPSTTWKSSDTSKSQGPKGKAPKTRTNASQARDSTQATQAPQTPVVRDTWWRGYAGLDQQYERRNPDMDDIRRVLARRTGAETPQGSSERTRPPVSTPPAKRPRLNHQGVPPQATCNPPPVPSTSSALPPTPCPTRSTFQAPARPVGRMIVPSQHPGQYPLPLNTFLAPGTVQRFDRAAMAAQLRHPQPMRVNDFTRIGAPCMRAFPSCVPLLYRPPNPQPPP
ncbi:hypothetical protein FRC12_002125 [Ceratobasidium sp. 428]|nr:hypothetical protein FRC09_020860 [Ceratobasidium sp. 395]KAG8793641.1 hypothetical protein FRC12_002125 [Ceratobasidium sp. 428]